MKNIARAACLMVVMTFAAVASADSSATADALFKEGREALEKGDYETACSKLAESNRLERAVGTLISLAQCEEKLGQLAGARQHWQEAAAFADALEDRLKRGDYAREHFASIDPRVPRLTVKRAPNTPAAMTIQCDDASLTSASLGTALPLDPGKHTVVVSAPDHEIRTFDVTLSEGEKRELEVGPGARKPEPPTVRAVANVKPSENTVASTEDKGGMYRITAYGLGGLGVVGLGFGTAFGLMASSTWSEAQSGCKVDCGPGSRAQDDRDTANTQGNISTVAFIGGGVLIAAAAVVWLVAPSSSSPTKSGWIPAYGPRGASAAYRF